MGIHPREGLFSQPFVFNKKEMVVGFDSRFKINRLNYHVGNGKFCKKGVVEKDVLISLKMIRDK